MTVMKRATKILFAISIVTMLVGMHPLRAQESDSLYKDGLQQVTLIARCYGDSVVLRWAPANAGVWLLGSSYGWRLERDMTDEEYEHRTDTNQLSIVLNDGKPILPLTLEQMQERFDSTNLFAGAAAQALYGTNFNNVDPNGSLTNYVFRKDQEQTQRQFLAYLAAEGHPEISDALGLRYVDKSVKKGQVYVYTLYSNIPQKYAEIREPSLMVVNEPFVRTEEEMMPEIKIEQIDGFRAIVYWQRNKLSGYYVERSTDKGKHWTVLNETPIYGYDPDEAAYKVHGHDVAELMIDNVVFFDSLELNTKYMYRVRAFDAFGDLLPYRESSLFAMIDVIPPVPPIILGCEVKDNMVCTVHWEKLVMEEDFAGYILTFSDNPDGPWNHITDVLSPKTTKYVDEIAGDRGRGYYRLFAFDNDKNVSFSGTAINNIEDVVPPTAPTGLKALIDTAGVAHFTWNENPEKDVLGYRVFFANQMDHDFTECSHGLVSTNFFVDTLDCNTITKYAYFYINAEDNSHNVSKHSDTIAVPIPDKIPPQPCILDDITQEGKAVVIRWTKSASEDVQYYFVYRKTRKEKQWHLLQVVNPAMLDGTDYLVFIDYPTPSSVMYNYCIEAVDDFRNSSGRKGEANITVREDALQNIPIELKSSVDNGSVTLQWNYTYKSRNDHYGVIYRSLNGGDYNDVGSFKRGETTYTDYKVKAGDKATYFIVLYLGEGKRSTPSNIVTVTLK